MGHSAVYFIADVHLGNHRRFGGEAVAGINRRCQMILDAIDLAIKKVYLDAGMFVVAGDLFDTSHPSPQVIAAAQRAFADVETSLVMGNHDLVSSAPGDHALGPLHGFEDIRVFSAPTATRVGDGQLVIVPFQPGPAVEWFDGALAKAVAACGQVAAPRCLVIHLGIEDDSTPPWLKGAHDSIRLERLVEAAKQHGIQAVLAGNWHSRRHWKVDGVEVLQIGALVPTGFDNPGEEGYGTLARWSPGAPLSWTEIPGPRFIKVTTTEDLAVAMVPKDAPRFISAVLPSGDLQRGLGLVEKSKGEGMVEILPDDEEALASARMAASAARSASTLEEALERFINEMALEEGVDRQRVLARSREFLSRGGSQ